MRSYTGLHVGRSDGYRIRRGRRKDRADIVDLYRSVLDPRCSSAWFDWKYEQNPHATDIPIFIATHDGELVGAGGFLPLEMHTGSEVVSAVQPCDAAVAPNHRRNGLYTEILGTGLAHYASQEYAFAFDFPNTYSKRAFEHHGWRPVGRRVEYVRTHRPSAILGHRYANHVDQLWKGGMRLLDRFDRGASTQDGTLRSFDDIPASLLANLYARTRPRGIHAHRTREFYDWRFENPLATYRTYVIEKDGAPIAAIIGGTQTTGGKVVTSLTDVLPLAYRTSCKEALIALLRASIADAKDADIIMAPDAILPGRSLTRLGFIRDNRFPLSRISTPTIHGVKPLAGLSPSSKFRLELTDPSAWNITFAEYDTR